MKMATNKVATIILLDVSQMMSEETDNGESFFERSLKCIKRIILRKIFSLDNDDVGVILFGSDNTLNNLVQETNDCYNNIYEMKCLSLPDWKLYEKIENLQMSSVSKSNWVEGLVVAQDFVKNHCQGRKYKSKQIVIFCNLKYDMTVCDETVDTIVKALEKESVKLIAIGNDITEDHESKDLDSQISGSLQLMLKCVSNLEDAVQFSFSDIEQDLKYYEQKRRLVRFYSTVMNIGSKIQLPVRWMKINKEPTRFNWEIIHDESSNPGTSNKFIEHNDLKFETDIVKRTNFGGTEVELSYADLDALKRTSGPTSLTYLGCIKREKISHSMFVGKDQYLIIADKNARSVAMFSAFVDALLNAKKYGIGRRVAANNGKIVIGAMLPTCDEFGKALYFMKLPYAEYVQNIPMIHIPVSTNTEAKKAINNLIESRMLPDDLNEEGKGILLRDPTFQSRCHALHLRAIGKLPENAFIPMLETVKEIINPFPLNSNAKDALKEIAKIFPFQEPEQKKSKNQGNSSLTDYQHIGIEKKIEIHAAKNDSTEVDYSEELQETLNFVNTNYDAEFSEEML